MPMCVCCSERYYDDIYEYRHVVLPQEIAKKVPKGRLMSEVGDRLLLLLLLLCEWNERPVGFFAKNE